MAALKEKDKDLKAKVTKLPVSENADPATLEEIHKSLMVMQSKPNNAPSTEQLEGVKHEDYILKKASDGSWKKYWATLKGDKMLYFRAQTDTKEKGMMEVSFVTAKLITSEDTLARKQAHDQGGADKICKYRVSLYTPTEYLIFSGESDAQVEAWLKVIQTLLSLKFTPEELEGKTKAAEHLEPFVEQQRRVESEQYNALMKTLQSTGLFWRSRGSQKSLKEGYMKVREEDAGKTWRKYYFRLYKDHLSYFRLDDKSTPTAVIALNFIVQINPQSSEARNRTFKIVTPLRSYLLKAKHDVSMKDWINALNATKAGKPIEPLSADPSAEESGLVASLTDVELPANDAIYDGELRLLWKDEDGDHTFKFKNNKKITIGRSSVSDCQVIDSRLSRNHCAIELRGKVPIFMDLGSSHGSKINGNRVSKKVLVPGDIISVGDTKIVFQVVERVDKKKRK